MIKALAFIVLLSSVFASQDWINTWYVIHSYSEDYGVCDVPASLTIANITLNEDNTLNLQGMQFFEQEPYNWTLNWERNSTLTHFCQEDGWCANGTLTLEKGVPYATIDWYTPRNPIYRCGGIMIPANMFWTGKWLVMESHQDRYCPVPQNDSVAEILVFGEQLLMVGIDNTTGLVSSWTLNFTAQDQNTFACINPISLCTKAVINIEDFLLCGNITWYAYNFWQCSVFLIRLPDTFNVGDDIKRELGSFETSLPPKVQDDSNAEDLNATIPLSVSDEDLPEERLEELLSLSV